MGFLTSHSKLSNTCEHSLQLVNPKLTLPYWDWTIEELDAERESVDGEMVIKSPLFQESWFGTADPDDYMVRRGSLSESSMSRLGQLGGTSRAGLL